MSYPRDGVTYLERIRSDKAACQKIEDVFYALRLDYVEKHDEEIEFLPIDKQFELLGRAFYLASDDIYNSIDQYHFVEEDVLQRLLGHRYDDI